MPRRWLEGRQEQTYALLRCVSGTLFLFHGAQKCFRLFGRTPPELGTQLWFGGWIELITGAAIALGLGTRIAAFVASGTMAVAYTQFHWQLELGEKLLPAQNKGELALLYAFLFLYLAARGDGRYSLSALRARARNAG